MGDDDDRSIESIEKEIGIDIQNEFSPNKENVDKIVAKRKEKLKRAKKKEEQEFEKKQYEHYLKLKEKFEKK